MDRTVSAIIASLSVEIQRHLQGLGDYPQAEPFEHGVQVGTYRGLQLALDVVTKVLNDEAEADARR
jgi:hypothetical protein